MRPTRFEVTVLLIMAGIIAYQLFTPPLIGLADSGDFERLLPWRGLAHLSADYNDKYFLHFNSKYQIIEANPGPDWYLSSTSLLIIIAKWCSIKIGQNQLFDIRMLALFQVLFFVIGIWLILVAARLLSISLRIILCVLLIIIFTDIGYTAYFNSFYSEGTAFSFLLISIGSSLILITRKSSRLIFLISYFLALAMVITSKPMYVPIAPAFALIGVYVSRYTQYTWRYLISSFLALSLCCLAAWYYLQTPQLMKDQNPYIGIFMDLLPNSSNRRQDLVDLGLNPDLEVFSGTTPYQADSPFNNSEFRAYFVRKVSTNTIIIFYLTHPYRLYKLCERCVKHAFSTRVKRLGYYEVASGKSGLSQPFGLWSRVRETVFPRSMLFLGLFFATNVIAVVFLISSGSTVHRGMYLMYLLFNLIAVVQFFVGVLAGGGEPDLEKHLFMFNFSFDTCLILLTLGAADLILFFRPTFMKYNWTLAKIVGQNRHF